MAEMYLVRRENCKFIGPMTLQAFREGLKVMSFGLQDEVVGNCGTWVMLENEQQVRKYHPELAAIITVELPVAWREVTNHAALVSRKEVADPSERKERQRKARKRRPPPVVKDDFEVRVDRKSPLPMIAAAAGVVAVLSIGVGMYMKSREEQVPAVADLAVLAQKADTTEFLALMSDRMPAIVARVQRAKDSQSAFLPFVRMFAFATNGSVEGLPQKVLRGTQVPSAPNECTVEGWKKRWRSEGAQTASWINGKALAKNSWTKALSWDPAWIRRRPVKGWIKPRNWYEGCLMTANAAARAIASDPSFSVDNGASPETLTAVNRRLVAQLALIQQGQALVAQDQSTVTATLTCMDQAPSLAEFNTCKQTKFADQTVQQMVDEHAVLQAVRLALPLPSVTDQQVITDLTGLAGRTSMEDAFAGLDLSAEIRYATFVQQAGWKNDGILDRLSVEFPDVRFKP